MRHGDFKYQMCIIDVVLLCTFAVVWKGALLITYSELKKKQKKQFAPMSLIHLASLGDALIKTVCPDVIIPPSCVLLHVTRCAICCFLTLFDKMKGLFKCKRHVASYFRARKCKMSFKILSISKISLLCAVTLYEGTDIVDNDVCSISVDRKLIGFLRKKQNLFKLGHVTWSVWPLFSNAGK